MCFLFKANVGGRSLHGFNEYQMDLEMKLKRMKGEIKVLEGPFASEAWTLIFWVWILEVVNEEICQSFKYY